MAYPSQVTGVTVNSFTAFFAAAFVLAVIPGPGMLYVVSRTLAGGRRSGFASVVGIAIGGCTHALAAALGLSAIIATSAQAYMVVRFAGAAYLIYLGVRVLLERDATGSTNDVTPRGQSFRQGIVTELLNPKTAMFFLAFIPPFIPIGQPQSTAAWFLLLGLLSVALNTAADAVAVIVAARLSATTLMLPTFTLWRRRSSGATLIGMGVLAATHSSRP